MSTDEQNYGSLLGGLLGLTIDIKEVASKLAGKTFTFEQGTISFPINLQVTTSVSTRNVLFSPPATFVKSGVFKVSANVLGVTLGLDQITLMIDNFPDLTINLKW